MKQIVIIQAVIWDIISFFQYFWCLYLSFFFQIFLLYVYFYGILMITSHLLNNFESRYVKE